MVTRKEELLSEIVRLQKTQEELKQSWKEKNDSTKDLRTKRDKVQETLRLIREEYEKISSAYTEVTSDLRQVEREGQKTKQELESLQRELQRLLEDERIAQAYTAQFEEFKNKCLEAPWRAENRDDGKGALTHQIDGAILAAVAQRVFLGDKRGLGKSLTSIIWQDLLECKRVIIINPSDTMDNMIREIQMWAPHRRPIKLGKLPKGTRDFLLHNLKGLDHFIIVTNYEAWRRDPEYIQSLINLEADTLILDEAHYAKNLSTVTAKGIKKLRFGLNQCPNCDKPDPYKDKDYPYKAYCANCNHQGDITDFCSIKYVMPMTGTGFRNKPQDLFPHLHILDPKGFPSEDRYLWDFCFKEGNRWTWRPGGEQALIKRLGNRYIARDRNSAGIVIPPPARIKHVITMEDLAEDYPGQHKAYQQAREYAQIVLNPDTNDTMSITAFITVLLRLRQVLVWPAAIVLERKDPDTGEILYRQNLEVYESAKLDKAEQLIRELVEEGERVVLFSQFKPGLHILQERLGDIACVYDGSTPAHIRNEIQLDFDPKTASENPRWKVCLLNYKTGGVGLNLNAAHHGIFLDSEWNPGGEDQAEGRYEGRLDQALATDKWSATTHIIQVEKSVDIWMENLITQKAKDIGALDKASDIARSAYDALLNGDM